LDGEMAVTPPICRMATQPCDIIFPVNTSNANEMVTNNFFLIINSVVCMNYDVLIIKFSSSSGGLLPALRRCGQARWKPGRTDENECRHKTGPSYFHWLHPGKI